MKATADVHGRECGLARVGPLRGERVRSAAVDGVRAGRFFYTLMQDISDRMDLHILDRRALEGVITGMAALHAAQYEVPGHYWCSLDDRLLLLTRGIHALRGRRDVNGLTRHVQTGWELFARRAPRRVRDLVEAVRADTAVLGSALAELPTTSLHGDLKLDNMGLDRSGVLWLIDWALAVRGPACVELGWFIAVNSDRLGLSPQQVVDLYTDAAALDPALHHRHTAMTALCGLLLRGWHMATDLELTGRADEFAWWCELAEEAAQYV
ncbi:phosphotransferase [Streptomyces sp. NPDC002928]|uniref:phosphotransferase family protein n=1 Tax=Streptomyces sp. NPDC002928 TaxID=3154440 RepID=UPI0033B2D1AC